MKRALIVWPIALLLMLAAIVSTAIAGPLAASFVVAPSMTLGALYTALREKP